MNTDKLRTKFESAFCKAAYNDEEYSCMWAAWQAALEVAATTAAPDSGESGGEEYIERVGEVAALYGRLLSQKRDHDAERGVDQGMAYYVADAVRRAVYRLGQHAAPAAHSSAPSVEIWQYRVAGIKEEFPSMTHEEAARNALLREVIELRAALAAPSPTAHSSAPDDLEDLAEFVAEMREALAEKNMPLYGQKLWKAEGVIVSLKLASGWRPVAAPSPTVESAAPAQCELSDAARLGWQRLLSAAKVYAFNYCQDEAEDEEDCVCGAKQHDEARELFAAIAAIHAQASKGGAA